MAFGGFSKASASAPMAEINMVPLIDVMLVLLVIFIITAPLLTHAVKVELPRASSTSNVTQPENIQLAIKANSEIYWNGEHIADTQIASRMTSAARLNPQPELHLRADRTTSYEKVAQVISAAAKAGLTKIGFVTEPASDR